MKTSAILCLLALLVVGSLAQQGDQNITKCDVDNQDLLNKDECLEAAIIVNLRENFTMNTELEERIDAFIVTQSPLVAWWWSLDTSKQNPVDNQTFFDKVLKVPDYDLLVKPGALEPGTYNLILYALNEKRKLSYKSFLVIMKKPRIWVEMSIEPKEGKSLEDEFTFTFTKKGEEDIFYALSYIRGERLITIDAGMVQSNQQIPSTKYKFPILFKDTQPVDIILDYYTNDQDRHTIMGNVTLNKPPVTAADLEKYLDNIEKTTGNDIDLKLTLAVVTSMFTLDFDKDYHHTEHHFQRCDKAYCMEQGECSLPPSGWKQCKCEDKFEGWTCAFEKGKEKEAIHLLKRVTALLDRANVNLSNIGQMTEIIKVIASTAHTFSWEVVDGVLKNIDKAIDNLKEAVVYKDIIEDIFIAIENLNVAMIKNYWLNKSKDLEKKTYEKIRHARKHLDVIFDGIFKEVPIHQAFVHPMEKSGVTLITSTPSKIHKGYEQVIVQSEMGRRNQFRIESFASITTEFLEMYTQKVADKSVGIITYQTYYNPYEIVVGDQYIPISQFLTVRLKDLTTRNEIKMKGKYEENQYVQVVLKADKERVTNLKDIECATYIPERQRLTLSGCETNLHDQYTIECVCDHTGEFVLVTVNPDPVDPRIYEPNESTSFEMSQVILIVVMISGVWGATYVASLREGVPNPPYTDGLSVHPLYSILMVYTADTPRGVRVHLFFISLTVQLFAVAFFYQHNTVEGIKLALMAVGVSIPSNYIFGLLSRAMIGSAKAANPPAKGYFIILAEALIVGGIIYANILIKDKAHQPDEIKAMIQTFLMSICIDVIGLDVLAVLLAKVGFIKNVLALRGFYAPYSQGDNTTYLRQQDVAL